MGNQEIIRTDTTLVRIMELAIGESNAWHYHSEIADFFVCLSGSLQLDTRNPDATILLQPGETFRVQPPQWHRVLNPGHETARYLLVQGVGKYDFITERV